MQSVVYVLIVLLRECMMLTAAGSYPMGNTREAPCCAAAAAAAAVELPAVRHGLHTLMKVKFLLPTFNMFAGRGSPV
jgi:hypothetical protein